ncbi:hypothetical protein Hanom_Chr08g00710041 [Helianthus anomalus]
MKKRKENVYLPYKGFAKNRVILIRGIKVDLRSIHSLASAMKEEGIGSRYESLVLVFVD